MSDHVSLGSLVHDNPGRDAIHLAIVPVTANKQMKPGQPVKLIAGTEDKVEAATMDEAIGVVDPFLRNNVPAGLRFMLCLKPNTVTSLKHHWTHPAFSELTVRAVNKATEYTDSEVEDSKEWLEDFADDMQMSYQQLLEVANNYLNTGHCYCLSFDTPERVWSDAQAFWEHFNIATGGAVPRNKREDSFFRCAC